jgi:uncharacterized protein (DUF1697 family)
MPTRRYVALYRNVNLGQRTSPTGPQFIEAFTAAGACEVETFMTNGTIVYTADSLARARAIPLAVAPVLHKLTRLTEPAFVRSLAQLTKLVATNPFAGRDLTGVYECCFTPLPDRLAARLKPRLPLVSTRGDCEVFAVIGADALGLTRQVNGKAGYPTKLIETLFDQPVTTRNWNTIVRLIRRTEDGR